MKTESEKLKEGGNSALAELFEESRERLERMIEFRLDHRLRGRVDPQDILQETWMEAAKRMQEYIQQPSVSFFVWIRQLAHQATIGAHRRHFGQKRDPRLEVNLHKSNEDDATSRCILSAFLGQLTTPSQAVVRLEEIDQLKTILAGMEETDREILALRHFEQLTNTQVAEILGLSTTAASNRYVRAMARLSDVASRIQE